MNPHTQPKALSDDLKAFLPAAGINLGECRLGPLAPDFYSREVLKQTSSVGYEYGTHDYHTAIDTLNSRLNLGLDAIDRKALSMLLTAVRRGAARFGGDPFIEPEKGENSAAHQVMCVPLATEFMRRADWLDAAEQAEDLTSLRLVISLGLLIHDCGEIFGEFSSLASRTQSVAGESSASLEKQIFKFAAELVYFSLQSGNPALFYDRIHDLRMQIGIKTGEKMNAERITAISDLLQRESVGPLLQDEFRQRSERLVNLFEMIEERDPERHSPLQMFCSYAIKAIEHIQGSRHILRFCLKGDRFLPVEMFYENRHQSAAERNPHWSAAEPGMVLPTDLLPSYRTARMASFTESELGDLFRYALTPAQQKLASAIRDGAYATMIEMLNAGAPAVERHATAQPVEANALFELLASGRCLDPKALLDQLDKVLRKENERLIAMHISQRRAATDPAQLCPVETQARLMSVYQQAISAAYIPQPGEVLLTVDALPEQLQFGQAQRWHLKRKRT